ncbi:MAG TPA: nuclear transport factor 2 family protein [Ktedonobacteraceae bacterium]|jgi:limonene-1,2-epoxide hydrolase|nr:nuclear transport factor 2 family protein [Ktedonobacteraceae bacterium]
MTEASDIVQAFMEALETRDYERAKEYLADDFRFEGFTTTPLDRGGFLLVMKGLATGMPNMSFHFQGLNEAAERAPGSVEEGFVQITGKQTETFELIPLNFPPIPQSNNWVSLPESRWEFTVNQGKIRIISVEHKAGGGITGLLQQLGVRIPLTR